MKKVGLWFYENDAGIVIKKQLVEKLEKKGYEVYAYFDMRECYLKNGKVYAKDGYCLSDLDILYHMNADEQNAYQNDILKLIELSGVHVFNDYNAFMRCKDKVVANMILRQNNIPVPNSMLINNHTIKDVVNDFFKESGSFLIKPRTNHGGKGIMKIDTLEQFWDIYTATSNVFDNYYIEQFIEFDNNDYRVEIFNGEVVGGYSRTKNGTYKTNVSSGGGMLDLPVCDEVKELGLKAAKVLGVTTTIVDMIRSKKDNKLYILEVNPMMGIFIEAAEKSGSKRPVQKNIPEQFKTDEIKMSKIINYIDDYCNNI